MGLRSRKHYCNRVRECDGIITTPEEFKQHSWQKIDEVDFSMFEKATGNIPAGMKIVAGAADIFTNVWLLMGFEKFCFLSGDNPELVERLFQKVGSFMLEICSVMLQYDDVGALLYSDDIAYTEGLMVSPDILRKYLFPWMKKMGELVKKRNIPYIYHSDGKLWQVMEDLEACGINALHPIEPKAMDAEEVKKKYGHRFCLIGNVDIDRVARGTPKEITDMVRDRISKLSTDGGYCVGSSSSIPEYVPIENYKALLEASLKYTDFFFEGGR